jgi:hypothetical protein
VNLLAAIGALALIFSGLAALFAVLAVLADNYAARKERSRPLPPPQTTDYKNVVAMNNYRTLRRRV